MHTTSLQTRANTKKDNMTSSSVMSPDEMISSFPNSILKEVKGEPNYENVVTMRDKLKENYVLVPLELGGG